MELIVCQEQYGTRQLKRKYVRTEWGTIRTINQTSSHTSFTNIFWSILLPQGYPESVSSDYLEYQLWDTVQAFSSSITGTLSAQAILKGVGVGDENATVLAATITWLLKSGTGMIGQIIFAWQKSSQLVSDCKRWRLFADILNDMAIFLEMIAPLFMDLFRGIVCVAGVMKAIVGCAGGATRASLTQHQAQRNNMADVSAKDGSQETLVNLAALLFSLLLVPYLGDNYKLVWCLFLLFTSIHLFANYKAVRCVTMNTFNQERLHIVCQAYLSSIDQYIMGVSEANRQEPVIFGTRRYLRIHHGVSANFLSNSTVDADKLLHMYKNHNYLLQVNLQTGDIHIVLHITASNIDQIRACFHAEVLKYAVKESLSSQRSKHNPALSAIIDAVIIGNSHEASSLAFQWTQKYFAEFLAGVIQNGWDANIIQLNADEWRSNWSVYGISEKKNY